MPSRSDIQELICLILRLAGIPWFLREVFARHKVTIINYHDPKPAVFEHHMVSFSRLYNFIDIDSLAEALEQHTFPSLPDKPLLVTLDDGYIGNARLFEIIRRYRIPVVIYAVAGVVNTGRSFWFDRLPHSSAEMMRFKMMPDEERREVMKKEYAHCDERIYDEVTALSACQMQEIIAMGGTIGSHTLFHPLLSRCNAITGQRECSESKTLLEAMTGVQIRHFAFPDGSCDERTEAWVKFAGYRTARMIHPGWVNENTSPYALPDFGISDAAGRSKSIVQACGLWSLLTGLLRNKLR